MGRPAGFGCVILRDVRSRLSSLSQHTFAAGDVICRQGEEPKFMFVISQGEVEFRAAEEGREEIVVGKLGPGDCFGDMAILSDTPFQATARPLTEVQGLVIHREDLSAMYTHLPDLRERLKKGQERRTRMVEENLKKAGRS